MDELPEKVAEALDLESLSLANISALNRMCRAMPILLPDAPFSIAAVVVEILQLLIILEPAGLLDHILAIFGKPVLYTQKQVQREAVPEGWHCYDLSGFLLHLHPRLLPGLFCRLQVHQLLYRQYPPVGDITALVERV